MMRKSLGFFAAGGLASLVIGGAQAKMVRYEINGQRYSYNTTLTRPARRGKPGGEANQAGTPLSRPARLLRRSQGRERRHGASLSQGDGIRSRGQRPAVRPLEPANSSARLP